MRRFAAVVLLGTGIAHAEGEVELHDGLTRQPTGPLLDVDIMLQPFIGAVDVDTSTERVDLELGRHTRASIEQSTWNTQFLNGNGWGSALRLVHDFKVIQVGVDASFQRVDSAFEHGSYTVIGASIMRTLRLSKWMTGWISLGVGRLKWNGIPPKGEIDATTFMLSVGTTFR